jgi:alpha-tubulin suppressor-like RCC1 family protein
MYKNHYFAAIKHPFANSAQTIYGEYGNMCVLISGYLRCWGDNKYGQLANWSKSSTNYPTSARLGDGQYMQGGITDVSIGDNFICAVRNTIVYCVGSNSDISRYDSGSNNQSGSGLNWYGECPSIMWGCATQLAYIPLRTAEGQDIVDNVANVESGWSSSCFVARDGSVWCWGYGWTNRKPTRVKYADGAYMGS